MDGRNVTGNDDRASGPAVGSPRPVIVGEVLFDVFSDGARVLGGAPFNVAWHLEAFGLRPFVVTRVGDDELGNRITAAMDDWGMDRSGVQVDPDIGTGRVRVDLDGAGPSFEILPDQAYDRLDPGAAAAAVAPVDAAILYHGSLIARSAPARAALDAVREAIGAPVFIDVNLRDPWWQRPTVLSLLDRAHWAKLNDDELARLADPPDDPSTAEDLETAAEGFADRHGLTQLVVTCGDRGAVALGDGRLVVGRPPPSVEVVDTVGAGDAFSAVWIAGAVHGWPLDRTLVRALGFAAAVCGLRGATTDDRGLYDQILATWEEDA